MSLSSSTAATAIFLIMLVFTTPAARANDSLKRELEANYEAYRKSIVTKDYKLLSQSLSAYKLMHVRNNVVSLKQPFPEAVFRLQQIFRTPSLGQLRLLRAESKGATARAVYYGPVNIGNLPSGKAVPNNLLVLQFLKERGGWKFRGLDAINITGLKEIHDMAKRRDASFIDRDVDVFPKLTGKIPVVPKPCPKPAHIGSLTVISEGYETTVELNRIHIQKSADSASKEVIMGGLLNGNNPIFVHAKPIKGAKTRRLEITVSVIPLYGEPFDIFSYRPKPESVMEFYNGIVRATASTFSRKKNR